MIRVLSSGLLTTIQDLGRPSYCHIGVSAAGAADPVALRVANRLVGSPDGAGAFEMTLRGGRFLFDADSVVSLCGGVFDASIPMWRAVRVSAGEEVSVGGCSVGSRCYLAVRGGVTGESYLGSVSTHLLSGFGRVIQRDDQFQIGTAASGSVRDRVVEWDRAYGRVRVTVGSNSQAFDPDDLFALLNQSWRVSEHSNRQGIRLGGSLIGSAGGAMLSEGVALGAIQVSPNGQPVILFVDSQTTGGYPVIANVAAVDIGVVGQLRPGSALKLEPVPLSEARRLLIEQEAWIRGI